MATPPSERLATTPSSGRALSIKPGARVLQSPLSDEAIWTRLKEAGFDEESIKRRDKAALIAYIAKLEAEIYDHQHHMGLLILERKELTSKYEQVKASAEAAEIKHKLDQASHLSALAKEMKLEESLKKALRVEKECVASIEKTLREMRAESAEMKVAAESKMAEARGMVEEAQKKFTEAEEKLLAAESLQAEANRYHHAAERKLKEVESREDDLRRRLTSFKSDCDEKEKELSLERQSLSERQKILQQGEERLLDRQALLNQREDDVLSRSKELNQLEEELEFSKENIEKELRALNGEKYITELNVASLSTREEAVLAKESQLNKKAHELYILQEKLASKESDEIRKVIVNHETALRAKETEFEAELDMKRKLMEDEIEKKRRAWELKDLDLRHWEDTLQEREHDLEVQSRALADREKDVAERVNLLDEKEKSLNDAEEEVELKKIRILEEKEGIDRVKLELQNSLESMEDKKKQVDCAKQKLESMKSETAELSILEMKLKEEIDIVRAQKLELMDEADKLKIEKAKFEAEWELIDEKREEVQKQVALVAEERMALSKFLKDERDSLRHEKDVIREQYKCDSEALCREREEFMSRMVRERTEWFNKIQQERADFVLDIEMQKRELKNCSDKKEEELESYLREREKAFELEKKNELQYINSLKETASKELEHVASEMKRLDTERMEINLDRERRDREWVELNNAIEELKVQRQKLKRQRELLHADREDIHTRIEQLKKLEDMKTALDNIAVAEMRQSNMEVSRLKISAKKNLKKQTIMQDANLVSHKNLDTAENGNRHDVPSVKKSDGASPGSSPFSWIKRYTELIFKNSPEKAPVNSEEWPLISDFEVTNLMSARQFGSSNESDGQISKGNGKAPKIINERQRVRYALGEPKVILEVPSVREGARVMHALETDFKEDANGKSADSISEEPLAGRKRRIFSSPSNNSTDVMLDQRQNNKKQRQQEDASVNPSEQAMMHCVPAIELSVPDDQHTSMPFHQTQGSSQKSNVLIIDKIIKISEVTCEISDTNTEKFSDQEKIVRLLNPVSESEPDILGGGAYGHANDGHVADTLSSCGLKVQQENIGTEHRWSQEAVAGKDDQKIEDHGVFKSDETEEVNGKVEK